MRRTLVVLSLAALLSATPLSTQAVELPDDARLTGFERIERGVTDALLFVTAILVKARGDMDPDG